MKSLATLLSARRALVAEHERTQKIAADCESAIAKLLDDAPLDDPKTSARLTELRTRAEVAPVKCGQLEKKIETLDREELKPAVLRAARQLSALSRAEHQALTARIQEALSVFVPPTAENRFTVENLVAEIVSQAPAYSGRIAQLDVSIGRFDRGDTDHDYAAASLLDLATTHKIDLDKLPEPEVWKPALQPESATSDGRDYVPRKPTRQELRDLEEAEARQSKAAAQEVVETQQS